MSKKKFIQEALEKLEDINSYQIKGGKLSSTGEYGLKDFTDNLLPILKDLIEDNIELKGKIGELESAKKNFDRKGMQNFLYKAVST